MDAQNYKEVLQETEYAPIRTIIKRSFKKSTLLLMADDDSILKLKTRELVVKEIIETEQNYLNDLNIIISVN